MSTFNVTAERLIIHPHPNADSLELAQVGLFRSVVVKGQYKTGDIAIFIPEQAILPPELLEELGLKLRGPEQNRVVATRLRGELSQGIVARPRALQDINYEDAFVSRHNFAEQLGITKWQPKVPANMQGKVYYDAGLMPWIDIQNIKRFPDIFSVGEKVVATEKVHGTCTLYTYVVDEHRSIVASKGLSMKRLCFEQEDTNNVYNRSVEEYHLKDFARSVADGVEIRRECIGMYHGESASRVESVGIFGETYGQGIQDLTYNLTGTGYTVFDIAVRYTDGVIEWLSQDYVRQLTQLANIPMVPELYRGPYDPEVIAAIAEGRETLSGSESNVREGVVVRPVFERFSDVLNGRAIGKWVSEGYLTRKGNATEYE